MIAPIVVPSSAVDTGRFDLEMWQRELVGVGLGSAVQRDGLCAEPYSFRCCSVARYWVVSPSLWSGPPVDPEYTTPPCPVCHHERYVAELGTAGRIELVRALVHTDAVETMAVLLDQAIGEGRTREAQWHNPDDLAEIAALKSLLTDRIPPDGVMGWAGNPEYLRGR